MQSIFPPFFFSSSLSSREITDSLFIHTVVSAILHGTDGREHLWISRSLRSLHTFPALPANCNLWMELFSKTKEITVSSGWIIYISSILYLAIASVPCTLCVVPGLGALGPVLSASFPVVILSSTQCNYWAWTQTLQRPTPANRGHQLKHMFCNCSRGDGWQEEEEAEGSGWITAGRLHL